MATYYLASQLSDAALDLLHIAGENETLQKLEDVHEILRDATPDDRFLAVRDLTDSLRLSMLRCINTAYRAAPSEFSNEFPALLDEHAEFSRAVLCYDGAPDDYQRAHDLLPKYVELRTADAESVPHDARHISKGLFSPKRTAPLEPQESARGKPLDLPLQAFRASNCTRCAKDCMPSFFRFSTWPAPCSAWPLPPTSMKPPR